MTTAFEFDPSGINPSLVPGKILNTGKKIPAIGLGTFGSDHATPLEVAEAVRTGIALGYRHIDAPPCTAMKRKSARCSRILLLAAP